MLDQDDKINIVGGGNVWPRKFLLDNKQRHEKGKFSSTILVLLLPWILSEALASGMKWSISSDGLLPSDTASDAHY